MAFRKICSLSNPACIPRYLFCSTRWSSAGADSETNDEFRVLEIYPSKRTSKKAGKSFYQPPMLPPREKSMPIDQDWPSVWPAAQTFRPSVVPLPVHQGYVDRRKRAPPGKYANTELIKIPNFLHLTPPAIKRHCEAIKKFCTEWPKALATDEDCEKHFPLEVITTDYCHSSPIIRDERARIVTFKIQLSRLNLDYHAKDKLIRLVGEERYIKKTDTLLLVADRCPLRKQNYDYLMYILSALYHESQVCEPWEFEKTEADLERFYFEGSRHEKHIHKTISDIRAANNEKELSEEELKSSKEVVDYCSALTELIDEGESPYALDRYKESVAKILGINVPIFKAC